MDPYGASRNQPPYPETTIKQSWKSCNSHMTENQQILQFQEMAGDYKKVLTARARMFFIVSEILGC
jgi:hypothetical protein